MLLPPGTPGTASVLFLRLSGAGECSRELAEGVDGADESSAMDTDSRRIEGPWLPRRANIEFLRSFNSERRTSLRTLFVAISSSRPCMANLSTSPPSTDKRRTRASPCARKAAIAFSIISASGSSKAKNSMISCSFTSRTSALSTTACSTSSSLRSASSGCDILSSSAQRLLSMHSFSFVISSVTSAEMVSKNSARFCSAKWPAQSLASSLSQLSSTSFMNASSSTFASRSFCPSFLAPPALRSRMNLPFTNFK
mmetsp:Transcript_11607/g.27835  ORF Transcript_11607/g.27835 Transcript_11607/m.27835 type:complete len:254 (+) Transcript_11607:409-1170(+)